MLLRKDGSMSAVALGVCHASLTHRGWRHGGHSVVMLGRQSFLCASPASPLTRVRRPGLLSQWQRRSTAIAKMHQFKVSASQVSVSALERRHGLTRLACASCWLPVASSAVVPIALPAEGRVAPAAGQATPLLIGVRWPGFSVSWQGGVPPCQSHWLRLAIASCWRRDSQQRDHVPP